MSGNSDYSSDSRRKTPWDGKSDRTPTQSFLFRTYKNAYERKHPPLLSTNEDELINSFVPDCCPYRKCGSTHIVKASKTRNGIQRYQCQKCGKRFTPTTGTIFDSHKISITEWVDFLLNLFRYVSLTDKVELNHPRTKLGTHSGM